MEDTLEALAAVPVAEYCARSGVDESLVRAAARRIAGATGGVAVFEDLGVQMNRHSTLVSWLEKLVWVLTGNFGRPGAQYCAVEPGRHHRRREDPGQDPGGRACR